MVITCISNFTKAPIAGSQYKVNIRIGDAPDHAKWDRTYNAYCDVFLKREGSDVKLGTIRLQLLPNEQTLFSAQEPQYSDSPFSHFLDYLYSEFKRLGFTYFEEEKPPLGFKSTREEAVAESPSQQIAPQDYKLSKRSETLSQKIWQWIESHKIISILGGLASIATIIILIITLTNL